MAKTRREHDSLGPVEVPAERLWGAQTQRSIDNFPIGRGRFCWGRAVIRAFGLVKKAASVALGVARDLADVVQDDDFYRLVGDIVLGRQAEDTFKTFREAGRALGLKQLAQVGEIGERDHDSYVKEANKLAQQIFIEHVRGAEGPLQAAQQPTTRL